MRLLGYSGWLLGYLERLLEPLLGYTVWLLRCCYAVARYSGWFLGPLLGYPRVVARVLLSGC